jgi:hypothetical protein
MAKNVNAWRNNQNQRNPPIGQQGEGRDNASRQAISQPLKPIKICLDKGSVLPIESILFENRLVLCFDGKLTSANCRDWIMAYTKLHVSHSLKLEVALIHSLFVILVEGIHPKKVVERLLADSPLYADNHYTVVYNYTVYFDPKNPQNFQQLVRVEVNKGSRFLCSFIDSIIAPIGKIVSRGYMYLSWRICAPQNHNTIANHFEGVQPGN